MHAQIPTGQPASRDCAARGMGHVGRQSPHRQWINNQVRDYRPLRDLGLTHLWGGRASAAADVDGADPAGVAVSRWKGLVSGVRCVIA